MTVHQSTEFASKALSLVMKVRPVVNRNRPIAVAIEVVQDRGGAALVDADVTLKTFTLGKIVLESDGPAGDRPRVLKPNLPDPQKRSTAEIVTFRFPKGTAEQLADGMSNAVASATGVVNAKGRLSHATFSVRIQAFLPIMVRSTDAPPNVSRAPQAVTDDLRKKLRVIFRHDATKDQWNVEAGADRPPVDVAYRVELKDGDKWVPLGSFVQPAGTEKSYELGSDRAFEEGDKVTLRFVPDQDAAARSVEVGPIWDKPVVLEDVVVNP